MNQRKNKDKNEEISNNEEDINTSSIDSENGQKIESSTTNVKQDLNNGEDLDSVETETQEERQCIF